MQKIITNTTERLCHIATWMLLILERDAQHFIADYEVKSLIFQLINAEIFVLYKVDLYQNVC